MAKEFPSSRAYLSESWREALGSESLHRPHSASDTSWIWGPEGERREGLVRSIHSCDVAGLPLKQEQNP